MAPFTITQYYKTIPLNLIPRMDYKQRKAKRFKINHTKQNVWIPNIHLKKNGELLPNQNIDYVFKNARNKLELAGLNYDDIF